MSDILDDLNWLLERLKADGDPDGNFRECKVTSAAIDEIRSLRTALENVTIVAGRASVEGLTFKDIKRDRVVVNNEGSAVEGN